MVVKDDLIQIESRFTSLETSIGYVSKSIDNIELLLKEHVNIVVDNKVKIAANSQGIKIIQWLLGSGILGIGSVALLFKFIS